MWVNWITAQSYYPYLDVLASTHDTSGVLSAMSTSFMTELELGKVHKLGREGVDMVVGKEERRVAGVATSPPYIEVRNNEFCYRQVIAMVLSNLGQWPDHVMAFMRLGKFPCVSHTKCPMTRGTRKTSLRCLSNGEAQRHSQSHVVITGAIVAEHRQGLCVPEYLGDNV